MLIGAAFAFVVLWLAWVLLTAIRSGRYPLAPRPRRRTHPVLFYTAASVHGLLLAGCLVIAADLFLHIDMRFWS
jgi:hypothetical protein